MKNPVIVVAKSSSSVANVSKPSRLYGVADAPSGFATVFQNFLSGQRDLIAVRLEIERALCISLEPSAAIEGLLETACERGQMALADYRILVADVRRITTEQSPTDVRDVGDSEHHGRAMPQVAPRPASSVMEPEMGSVLNNRYQLEELVASGPMGNVFRAADRLKQQIGVNPAVAIKMLNPHQGFGADAVARLRQEAFQAQRLAHPNIINIYDFDQAGEIDFISMEWLEGESLASLLDRNGSHPLKMSDVRRIIAGAAAALSFAHARGVVHGDIKPANIFLCRDGMTKIMDFGVVRGPVVKAPTDIVAAYAVTPCYASCELLEGSEPCAQDDVYALACTMFRMIAGFRPYGQQTALQAESGGRSLRRPTGVTSSRWRILRSGLALRRQDRLPDIDALLKVVSGPPNTTRAAGRVKRVLIALFVTVLAGAAVRYGLETMSFDSQEGDVARASSSATGAMERIEPAIVPQSSVAGGSRGADVQFGAGRRMLRDSKAQEQAVTGPPLSLSLAVPVERLSSAESTSSVRGDVLDSGGSQPLDTTTGGVQMVTSGIDLPLINGAVEQRRAVADVLESTGDDPAEFSGATGFVVDRFEVGESDGFVRLVVRAPPNLIADLRVRLIIEPGAAMPGKDYVLPARDHLEFSPVNGEETVLISLISDAIGEHVEDFTVRLEISRADLQLENAAAHIVIIDDD